MNSQQIILCGKDDFMLNKTKERNERKKRNTWIGYFQRKTKTKQELQRKTDKAEINKIKKGEY